MAISAANAVYASGFPNASDQVVVEGTNQDSDKVVRGKATFVLDGTLTSATLNLIDGTKTLYFTPTAFRFGRVGGTTAATISISSIVPVNNKTATVSFSAAGSNTETLIFWFEAMLL